MTANGTNYHQVGGAGTNTSLTESAWSGTHIPVGAYSTGTTNPKQHTLSWSYGSGSINRPLSRATKFYIKYKK